ncbi:glycerol-3-phosphate 1-O-acyltransferase PlsY [Blautia liquoris]|uniref:Glycerol-3-phosphate acyltransferase n=1 Tax=Blautia liquoris TaxID=2779518 RepID=A0A7M2RMB1_9FIRM|nr:glycerol-3-phosphate 1-O-acyltransferase PlsY [Blautia liquoris]QOV20480.1 glycerol-3-phosphate 1-O-acyltransferase PlsY [Blautia liquoris]
MERIICLIIGYCCGLFQTSYYYGKMHGIDIRQHGSGNAGTTNALRTLGKRAGIITLVGDCLKCMLAVWIVRLIYGRTYPDMIRLLGLYASAGTILGHNFPFYLKFKGGKGIAATAGMIISFDWRITLIEIVVFFGTFFITHYVSLGSLLVYVFFIILVVIMGQTGTLMIPRQYIMETYVLVILLALLAFWQHRKNIVKLHNGTENKTYLKKEKTGDDSNIEESDS